MAKDCWAKEDSKEGQNLRRKDQGKANIAQAEDITDAVWFSASYRTEQDKINQLQKESNNIPAFNKARNNSEELEGTYETTEIIPLISTNLTAVVITTIEPEHKLEIYDSGATQHMTPSRHRLTNF